MKNLTILLTTLLVITFGTTQVAAQDAFEEGKIVASIGYGAPNLTNAFVKLVFEDEEGYKKSGIGPMHLKFEYGLSDKIGFGLVINYVNAGASWTHKNFTDNSTYTDDVDFTSIAFNVRMNIHFATTDKLDPYWGVGAGYRTGKWKYDSNDPLYEFSESNTFIPIGFETTLGMRYYVADMFAFYVELGFAKSLIQGGLTLGF